MFPTVILRENLIEIGMFNKPHGINGEVNVTISRDVDMGALRCIIVDMEGIFVPFFLSSVRQRGVGSMLVFIDGVDSERQVAEFSGKTIYALNEDFSQAGGVEDEDDDDGMYAEDFIGYEVIDRNSGLRGRITDIDDSTENVLFIVDADNSRKVYIPVAEDFIEEIDVDSKMLTLSLPDGLTEI